MKIVLNNHHELTIIGAEEVEIKGWPTCLIFSQPFQYQQYDIFLYVD